MYPLLGSTESSTPKFQFTLKKKVIDDLIKGYHHKSLLLPQGNICSPELVLTDI